MQVHEHDRIEENEGDEPVPYCECEACREDREECWQGGMEEGMCEGFEDGVNAFVEHVSRAMPHAVEELQAAVDSFWLAYYTTGVNAE